jgi:probable F420-dependent oxidoreductase
MIHLGVSANYRSHEVADPDHVAALARAIEEEGGESIWTVEHVVVPTIYQSVYPYSAGSGAPLTGDFPIPDPLDWLAFVAGVTRTLKLGTAVVILPQHNPVEYAKRVATVDALSKGRLLLGIGVGWMSEESEAMGIPWAQRGARTDETIDLMRTLWRDEVASFQGRFYDVPPVKMRPKPARPAGVPIIIGGHSKAAARRAGRRGDGYYPLGIPLADLPASLTLLREEARAAGRDPDAIELMARAPSTLEDAQRLRDLGFTRFTLGAPSGTDLDALRRRLSDYRTQILDKLG